MKDILGLQGQPTLVVGGGYGIGRATALLLAEAGAQVAVADIDGERAASVAKEVGGHAIVGDVTTAAGADAIVDEAHDVLGGLTRLANIVGRVQMREFEDTDPAQWQDQIQFNLVQQMHVCHAAGRHMRARGGAIAMVASVSGIYGARKHVAYGAAKAGVLSLARSLADEWGRYGIRVNTVAPDINATPRILDGANRPIDEALASMDAKAAREGVPLGRFGRPEEVAGPLLFLLSDLSSFMTGQCLVADGGTMARFPHAVAGEG
ncbi:MAG TPA: SDR family oxidoreductase [Phenylobacterium sp.]|uniref:SDR family NAD(P)-dependent oxidoreductase n=1 Tax=Phenylobacterium sp. TaxID=1871053 RepID=UPI002B474256|nr:SDR family oxidoreductase [Phenylobacterium sp.]HKR87453.1 SDR family oxidoreductase [Phenylobacterium sp.]HKT53135.1 SDR family oxidoreductase [Caulobacteraceae bacterium]